MFDQRDAIVKLLRDDDPCTVSLVKQQLADKGTEAIPNLEDLLTVDDETVTSHVRDVLGQIDARAAVEKMTRLCPVFPEHGDIESANWLLSRALLPGVDVQSYMSQLDEWAVEIGNLRSVYSAGRRVQILGQYIGAQLGFRGNSNDYYNADNSLLPRVIDTRLGIPISLTLLYMLVGNRCGVLVEGINFPGHFLARHDGVLFDPFQRGRIIGIPECRQILARQKLELQPAHLEAASALAMLRRILANLLYVYQNDGEPEEAALITSWIHSLERK